MSKGKRIKNKRRNELTWYTFVQRGNRLLLTFELKGINGTSIFSNTEDWFIFLWLYVLYISGYKLKDKLTEDNIHMLVGFRSKNMTQDMIQSLEERVKSGYMDDDVKEQKRFISKFSRKNVENFLEFLKRTPDGFYISSRTTILPQDLDLLLME